MGDDMDNVTKESKGDIYDQLYSPYYQKKKTIEFWQPVQEAGKLLAIMDDNHTNRSKQLSDWRIVKDVCEEIKARYGGFGTFFDLRIGDWQYTIYCLHGKRCGTTPSAALNALLRMRERCFSDIYLRGHHHQKQVHQLEIKKLTKEGLATHKQSFGITGSFLNWDDSYAEMLEYNLSVQGCIKIKLFVKKWDVHISL